MIRLLFFINTLFCIGLLTMRLWISESTCYMFLLWNLFLAWVPLFLSGILLQKGAHISLIKRISLFFMWLIFFPNAPYVVTDLIHLAPKSGVPLWYDLILILSFAIMGLMFGIRSLRKIHKFLEAYLSEKQSWYIVGFCLLLSGFGIYLGRFERWNSWDLLTHPRYFFYKQYETFTSPVSLLKVGGVTIVFALFTALNYLSVYFLNKGNESEK